PWHPLSRLLPLPPPSPTPFPYTTLFRSGDARVQLLEAGAQVQVVLVVLAQGEGEEVAGGAAVLDVHRQGELVHPVEHPHRECRVLGLPTSGQRHTPFGFVTGGLHGGPACESEVVAVSGDVLGSAVLEVVSGHEVGFIGVLRRHGGGHGPGTGRQRTRGQRSQGDPAPGAGTAAAW